MEGKDSVAICLEVGKQIHRIVLSPNQDLIAICSNNQLNFMYANDLF